jgi:hypothetical protein
MRFSLRRTTSVVVVESSEVGNPGTLGMTNRRGWLLEERVVAGGKGGCWRKGEG